MYENKIIYSLVIPIYNQELVIHKFYTTIKKIIDFCEKKYEIIFINDGSTDKTEELIKEICDENLNVKLLNLSRNFGSQSAITAGMESARGAAIIIMNGHLQDPPEIILEMINKWQEGYEVIHGKRIEKEGEMVAGGIITRIVYKFLNNKRNLGMPFEANDFRLIDRKVCNILNSLPEKNRYIKESIDWLGFKQTTVEFIEQGAVTKAKTSCFIKKMIGFYINEAITSSYKFLKSLYIIGSAISIISFLYLIVAISRNIFTNGMLEKWGILVSLVMLFNGIGLIIFGILGEYITRIYDEIKDNPVYVIREKIGFGERQNK